MSDRITAGVMVLMVDLAYAAGLARWYVRPLGRHRAPRPAFQSVLNEVSLDGLLDGGEVEANDFEWCPAEERVTFHAIRRDRSRRCWTCGIESAVEAS